MKQVIAQIKDKNIIDVEEINNSSILGILISKSDKDKGCVVEMGYNHFEPINMTAGMKMWTGWKNSSKKELVKSILESGDAVFQFDSIQEFLEWAAK